MVYLRASAKVGMAARAAFEASKTEAILGRLSFTEVLNDESEMTCPADLRRERATSITATSYTQFSKIDPDLTSG